MAKRRVTVQRPSLATVAHTLRGARGRLIVVSSPSGGGKTTVAQRVVRRVPRVVRSVSLTTRPRRRGERNGTDYDFMTPAAFHTIRRARGLLEWARVHGALYGTPRTRVQQHLARGTDVLLTIDVQGARQVQRRARNCVRVFLVPPTWDALMARLRKRQTDDDGSIARRVRAARREVRAARTYDYIIVNDRLEQAVQDLAAIICAERQRIQRRR